MTKKRQVTEPAPPVDYEAARQRWAAVEVRRQQMLRDEQGMALALSLARNPSDSDRVPMHLHDLAEPFLERAENDADALIAELVSTREEIGRFRVELTVEAELWHDAQRRETNRRALELQPGHRAAVTAMHDAVTALSAAIEAERRTRAQVGPLPVSRFLPDCSSVLCVGTIEERDSPLRCWVREMEKLGVLE